MTLIPPGRERGRRPDVIITGKSDPTVEEALADVSSGLWGEEETLFRFSREDFRVLRDDKNFVLARYLGQVRRDVGLKSSFGTSLPVPEWRSPGMRVWTFDKYKLLCEVEHPHREHSVRFWGALRSGGLIVCRVPSLYRDPTRHRPVYPVEYIVRCPK